MRVQDWTKTSWEHMLHSSSDDTDFLFFIGSSINTTFFFLIVVWGVACLPFTSIVSWIGIPLCMGRILQDANQRANPDKENRVPAVYFYLCFGLILLSHVHSCLFDTSVDTEEDYWYKEETEVKEGHRCRVVPLLGDGIWYVVEIKVPLFMSWNTGPMVWRSVSRLGSINGEYAAANFRTEEEARALGQKTLNDVMLFYRKKSELSSR